MDGLDATALAALLGAPRVALFDEIGSTMDEAHQMAAQGARAGTLVVADAQTAGRGRGGRQWESGAGKGLWFTVIERPAAPDTLEALTIRLGLRLAPVLDRYTSESVLLKWPNDFFLGDRKLGGILVEARWRDDSLDWVALGIGINVVAPVIVAGAAATVAGTRRSELLSALLPAARAAAAGRGSLSPAELEEYARRDHAAGRAVVQPGQGTARGIAADGALVIDSEAGRGYFRTGSLVYAGDSR